ncbi:hypothetical protein AVEN_60226-1 [Araneus ventricosus]|uniref:Uncharacterized protein n=1 Tax=Araneus ventricosus TaxID=182803 RepID=A0A4Y2CNY8_ARAVE|nr:hypothetical protein AVEN_60226-1 [Araneus ventricosus]
MNEKTRSSSSSGWKNSVIHRIENHVGLPLQWSICLLHFNELPFRHIFQHIDGQTAGPKSFSGPIEQQLTCYEKLPVVDYEPIDFSIPYIDISNAVTLGHRPKDLANRTLVLCSIPDGYCGQPSP